MSTEVFPLITDKLLLRDHLKHRMKTAAEICPSLAQRDSLQIRMELT